MTTFPTAIFIDAEGVIRGHKVGYSGFENLRDLALGLAFDEDAGDAEEVEAEEGWIDPETDDEGRTELLLAARDGDVDEIERLIADGAEPSERDRRGRTALAHAASAGEEKAIAMLLDAGADPNIADDAGHTPMAHAAISGHSAAVRALAEAGGSIDEPDFQGWTPLMHAARRGWADVVETLLELGRPGIKRSAGRPDGARLRAGLRLRKSSRSFAERPLDRLVVDNRRRVVCEEARRLRLAASLVDR
ncbi:MAG: ankyrin repeat domain-containing protein [Bryobacterales bacterium]